MTVSIEDQIREVAREIALRRNVYRSWVRSGKMTQDDSDKRIAAMEAVIETLNKVKEAQDASCRACGGKLKRDFSIPVIDTNPQIVTYRCEDCDALAAVELK